VGEGRGPVYLGEALSASASGTGREIRAIGGKKERKKSLAQSHAGGAAFGRRRKGVLARARKTGGPSHFREEKKKGTFSPTKRKHFPRESASEAERGKRALS